MAALFVRGIVQLQKNVILRSTKGVPNRSALANEYVRKDVTMSDTVQIRRPALHVLGDDLSAWLYTAMRRFEDHRLYRRSVRELSDLSTRELADLGLHRSEIKRVAHETVYGRRP